MKTVKYWKTKLPNALNLIAKRIILLLILGLGLNACGPQAPEKTEELPDWIIPEDKMVEVLTDVHIVEGARIGKKVLGDSSSAKAYYDLIWHKYGITEELYDSSFRFYSRNAERMDLMYEEVLTRLTKLSSAEEAASGGRKKEKDEEDE